MAPGDNFSSHSAAAAPAPEAAPQNVFSRLIGVWFSPGETFQSIGRLPDFVLPLLLFLIVTAATSYLTVERIGYENLARKQMQAVVDRGILPPERAEEAIQQQIAAPGRARIFSQIQIAVFNLVILLLVAGCLKLITMLMGAESRFSSIFSVTVYSYLAVMVVQAIITVILLYLKQPDEIEINNLVGSNLGALLTLVLGQDALPRYVTVFASFIDLFYIWRIVLLSIGLAAVAHKLKTSTAAMFIGGLFLFFALIATPLMAMFT
jgi:hypothetical protein